MIGVFDSGVGGMTVARAIEQAMPDISLAYFGDLARTPYGSKSSQAICRYSLENTEFLISKGAQLIVIACNSASSVATDKIRNTFNVPVFEVISPAIRQAIALTKNGRIGVIGTQATITSGIYEKLIIKQRPTSRVFSNACPLLVPLVEENWMTKRETKMIVRRYLHPLKLQQIDTLVLGCTHYPLLKHLIQPRIGKRVNVVDSSLAVTAQLREYLDTHPSVAASLSDQTQRDYYVSDMTIAAQNIADTIFGRAVTLQKVTL